MGPVRAFAYLRRQDACPTLGHKPKVGIEQTYDSQEGTSMNRRIKTARWRLSAVIAAIALAGSATALATASVSTSSNPPLTTIIVSH